MTKDYSRFMRKVATGVTTDHTDSVDVPKHLLITDKNRIIDIVFPAAAMSDPLGRETNGKWKFEQICKSALLCPTNAECNRTNDLLMVILILLKA
jgi:hypothetical protein